MKGIALHSPGIGRNEQALMINTYMPLAVEGGSYLSFGSRGDGRLGLLGNGASAAGLDAADHQRGCSRITEPEGDIQLIPFGDLAKIPGRRIQPLNSCIPGGVGHGGGNGRLIAMVAGDG